MNIQILSLIGGGVVVAYLVISGRYEHPRRAFWELRMVLAVTAAALIVPGVFW